MNRLVISENKAQQDAELTRINAFIRDINQLTSKLKDDTGYTATFRDIGSAVFSSTQEAIHNISNQLEAYLDGQLDQANVTSTLMRNNHKAGFKDFVVTFCNAMKTQTGKQSIEHLHNLAVVNGQLVLPGEVEESIRESFRNVIVSDQAKELWNLQNETAEKLQQLFALIKEKTRLEYFNIGQLGNDFFTLDFHTGTVNANMLSYEGIQKKKS